MRWCIMAALCWPGTVWGQIDHQFPGGQRFKMGQIKKDPAKEIERQKKACNRKIDAARKQVADKQWGQARLTLDRAKAIAVDASQMSRVNSLYQKVDQEGRRRLPEARKAYEAECYVEALETLEAISNAFGWLPSGNAARQTMQRYKSDPKVAEALAEAKAAELDKLVVRLLKGKTESKEAAAEKPTSRPAHALSRAERVKILAIKKQHRVVRLLERITKSYPDCPTGRRARADLDQLFADQTFAAKLAGFREQRKAQAALNKAEMYRKAGMTEQAAQFYKEVIESYPGTKQAVTAKARLSLLESDILE